MITDCFTRECVPPEKTTRTSESLILRTPIIRKEDSAFGSPSICSQTLIYYLHFKCGTFPQWVFSFGIPGAALRHCNNYSQASCCVKSSVS